MQAELLKKAGFFWHGSPLGIYEQVCISSFVKRGFSVTVYSYEPLQLPVGAFLGDAATILPKSYLTRYTQEGRPANLPAFSDAFRYHLLAGQGGWWFDTDVVCLASADRYANLIASKEARIGMGYEDMSLVNGAVLYAGDPALVARLLTELESKGTEFRWGAIGPSLLTAVVESMGLGRQVEDQATFYPVHWEDFHKLVDPQWTQWCESRSRSSLAVHLWNEMCRRFGLPADKMPPIDSFLHRLFLEIDPGLRDLPALDRDWAARAERALANATQAAHEPSK
jgi:hypothetical protein